MSDTPLSAHELAALDAHWRAANYLAAGQIYLMANPLLEQPLAPEHIKPRLLGHWGTAPGLNLVYTHLNRVIKAREQRTLCVWGPGHGGPAVLANSWLEGSYTQTYPDVTRDAAGMGALFKQFSFPGGVPSHVSPETPGSIHEGGELGYALTHAYGAAFDHPELLVACVIGDGRRRRDRSPPPGTPTSSSTRCTTGRSCRSCTSTGTRSPVRRSSPASRRASSTRCCAAAATSRCTSAVTNPQPSTANSPQPWTSRWTASTPSSGPRVPRARPSAPAGR
ncbi:hypothetical protein Sfulv_02520 [Streptomyces fulvorobeus]|uniref:Xylulose 5-phosphate/Fructose 6-phosphate phosphoketolase N-terminal domain-containing protein n=1 Tax=Streptomyces fulvorobeus TaxID=284028 RepID=A0A7J0BYZ6_9ACTN|nr:hypothetical protein Sfulv_02520 [Streptomyces fulvorobeus]